MSARKNTSEENSIRPDIKRLGIIAGSGTLPRDLYLCCKNEGMDCFVIGFKNHTNYVVPDFWGDMSKSAQIIEFFKQNKVQDIVFIGGVTRPRLCQLRPDWLTFKFFCKTLLKCVGDSSLLNAVRKGLEELGFTLHGVHRFMPELIVGEGAIGEVEASYEVIKDIELGVEAAKELGQDDIGQAVLLKEGEIIAREDRKGTNAMIDAYGTQGAILIKMCKPQQDKDLDLPTIGLNTVQRCLDKGMLGIVVEAGASLVAQQDKAVALANQGGLFIYGYDTHASDNT